jgi:hypothetical protein
MTTDRIFAQPWIAAVLALVLGAAANPAQAQAPNPPRSTQVLPTPIRPVPVQPGPVTPTQPRQQDGALIPLAPQGDLPVEGFTHSDLRCAPNLSGATTAISARLVIAPGTTTSGQVSVDVRVDGVSIGVNRYRVRNGGVNIERRVNLGGANGHHQIVFVLDQAVTNRRVQSQPIEFSHTCVSTAPTRADDPGHLALPNLAFGSLLYAQITHTQPGQTSQPDGQLIEPRVSLGTRWLLDRPVVVRNLQTTTRAVQFPAHPQCPRESEAQVLALVAISLASTRVADPAPYSRVLAGSGEVRVRYVDTRTEPKYADGTPVGASDRVAGTPLPQGFQWIVFVAPLQCTRNGVLEVRLDPDRRLQESNEADNGLRVRYATVR